MCIIVYRNAGIKLTPETIDKMWTGNQDGAGLAYYTEGGIRVIKGMMTKEDLQKELDAHLDVNLVFHVRNATAGKKNKFMCHPYVISARMKTALKPDCLAKAVLFHNGIISGFGNKKISDTADFVVNGLSHVDGLAARKTILRAMSGKYVIMQDGETWLMNGFDKVTLPEGEIECSHDRWNYKYTPYVYTPGNYSAKSSYLDDYEETIVDDGQPPKDEEFFLITHEELLAAGYVVSGYDRCDECGQLTTVYQHPSEPFVQQLCRDCLTYYI